MDLAPIVLFVYNRPIHTGKTLDSLKRNLEITKTDLFIFCDGPKFGASEEDLERIKETRKLCERFSLSKSLTIIKHDENLGLAKNIQDGVTYVVNLYEKAIVLEDDIVCSQFFLKYMNDALVRYEEDNRVMSISAFMPNIKKNGLNQTFFTYFTSCWGWATWKRSWGFFEKNPKKILDRLDRVESIKKFNLGGSDNLIGQVKRNLDGSLNTWAVFWYASVFFKDGLVLHPRESLTENIGHDGTGENCPVDDIYSSHLLNSSPISYFEESIENNEIACKAVKKFYEKRNNRLRLKKVIKKGMNWLRRRG